jgi:tetratricopeptide (TPR) repeat protein
MRFALHAFILLGCMVAPVVLEAEEDASWKRANSHFQKKEWRQAHHHFSQFLNQTSISPRTAEARARQGLCSLHLGSFREATNSWAPFLLPMSDDDPLLTPWVPLVLDQMLVATQHEAERQHLQRTGWLSRLLENYPQAPETSSSLARELNRLFAADQTERLLSLLEHANAVLKKGEANSWRRRVEVAVLKQKRDISGLHQAARILTDDGDSLAAREAYQAITKVGSFNHLEVRAAMLDYALFLRGQGEPQAAIDIWQKVLHTRTRDKDEAKARLEIARTQAFHLNQIQSARKSFQAFILAYPDSPEVAEARLHLLEIALASKALDQAGLLLSELPEATTPKHLIPARATLAKTLADQLAQRQKQARAQAKPVDPLKVGLQEAEQHMTRGEHTRARRLLNDLSRAMGCSILHMTMPGSSSRNASMRKNRRP